MKTPPPTATSAALLAFAMTLTGCVSSKDSPHPPVAPPAAFSSSGPAVQEAQWWKAFQDDTLNELVHGALTSNFTLRAAWDRRDQAEAAARRQGAALQPSVSGAAGAARTERRAEIAGPSGDAIRRTTGATEFSLGLSASWEADLWGRLDALRDAAGLDAAAAAEDMQAAALSLSAELTLAWLRLREKEGQVALLRGQTATNARALELVEMRQRSGRAGMPDVLQQRQALEANRGDMAALQAAREALRLRVLVLCGRSPSAPLPAAAAHLPDLPLPPETGLPAALLQRRPDVRRAAARVMAADRRAAAAFAERFPRLTLSGRASTATPGAADLFRNWLASLAGELAAPLLDGGARRAEAERAAAAAREQLNLYGQAALEAFAEVESALARERHQREALASLEVQEALAAQSAERILDQYFGGATDYLRVLNAAASHQSLQRRVLEARLLLLENRVALYRALAGGWDMPPPGRPAAPPENTP